MKDFFENRDEKWCFQDVLSFLEKNFNCKRWFEFKVWDRINSKDENQNAMLVLVYSKKMWYTFNQVKALFSEHDHFAIAMPEKRKTRNILRINNIYENILKKWWNSSAKICDYPDLISLPNDAITQKKD